MSLPSNVSPRVFKPNSANNGAETKNGARCHNASCTCGRAGSPGHRAASMGQKVITDLFLRGKQETAKYNLYMLVMKLIGEKIYDAQRLPTGKVR